MDIAKSTPDIAEIYISSLKLKHRKLLKALEEPKSLESAAETAGISYNIAFRNFTPLKKAGLAFRARSGRKFFYCSCQGKLKRHVAGHLKLSEDPNHLRKRHRRILEQMKSPASTRDLMVGTDLKYVTLDAALRQLVDAGLASRTRVGRGFLYCASEEAISCLLPEKSEVG